MTALLIGVGLWGYTYAGYPLMLWMAAARTRRRVIPRPPETWPRITIIVPAYNEAAAIAATIEALLALDYPADRRQLLVLSDASTDGTDAIVQTFAARGVELLRMPVRGGKTAAENAARSHITGEIVVNTDASVRPHPASLRRLVTALEDPEVGVASARDVSVARLDTAAAANVGESAYVGYEMWVRALETRVSGIVGASGCLYAIRTHLHGYTLPDTLSRDFAAALEARRRGFRAVSVDDAICFVPRGASLHQEYRRKVRTMTRGLATLVYFRRLLNPFWYGAFAWMLASHKLCRWLLPWASVLIVAACAMLAVQETGARLALAAIGAAGIAAIAGWHWPAARRMPRIFALPAFTLAGLVAGLHAWGRVLGRRPAPTWEPTRRGGETATAQ